MVLKNQKCITPVKGAIEIEATFVYTNVKFFILNKIVFLLFEIFSLKQFFERLIRDKFHIIK
jgi:hypothetical protein